MIVPRYFHLGSRNEIERGIHMFRRAGVPRSPSSKRICELARIADPSQIDLTRTDIVLWDDKGVLAQAYVDAVATATGYDALFTATSDQNVIALYNAAVTEIYQARLAIERLVMVRH